jgi:hypothetical protein
LFGDNLSNEEESPDDDGKELEGETREEGESLTTNIEKAEQAQSLAPQNPDPQKEEWEPPNEGVRRRNFVYTGLLRNSRPRSMMRCQSGLEKLPGRFW